MLETTTFLQNELQDNLCAVDCPVAAMLLQLVEITL